MLWYAWISIHLHLSLQPEEVVAVATFFRSKTGRGLLLAAGLLIAVASGPTTVFVLLALVALACMVELASFTLFSEFTQKKGALLAVALQGLIVTVGVIATLYVIDRYGLWATMVVVAAVYLENAGAQIFGKKYGRRPLAPRYSPNKTLEGAAYGWVCGSLGGLIFLGLAMWRDSIETPLVWLIVVLVAPPLAELGDWVESRMKRLVGVKDSSDLTRDGTRFIRIVSLSWLFGRQGGALDKTDSLWLVLCVVLPMFLL